MRTPRPRRPAPAPKPAPCIRDADNGLERVTLPTYAPAPKPARSTLPHAGIAAHARRAAIDALADTLPRFRASPQSGARDIALALAHVAELYGVTLPPSRVRRAPSIHVARLAVFIACADACTCPDSATLRGLRDALARFWLAHGNALARLPARLLSPTVRAPEPIAPPLTRAPSGALDWQTLPSIGRTPESVLADYQPRAVRPRMVRVNKVNSPRREGHNVAQGAGVAQGAAQGAGVAQVGTVFVARPNAHRATLTISKR